MKKYLFTIIATLTAMAAFSHVLIRTTKADRAIVASAAAPT